MTPVVPESALIDPYLEHGAFRLRAPFGQRGRVRTWIREMAATHKPPLRILVNADGSDHLYVQVIS